MIVIKKDINFDKSYININKVNFIIKNQNYK